MSADAEPDVQLVDFSKLKRADFEALLNAEFSVDLNYLGIAEDGTPKRQSGEYPADVSVGLKLVEVTPRDPVSPEFRQDPFTILFRGSQKTCLYSGVHLLKHSGLGNFCVLLTSVVSPPSAQPEEVFYEAVIG